MAFLFSIHQIVAFFNRSAIEAAMSTLDLILVVLLIIVLFGGGLGYRGGYGDSPYYGYGIGGIGLCWSSCSFWCSSVDMMALPWQNKLWDSIMPSRD